MSLGTHAVFIVAAYLVAAIVVIALVVWTILDHRAQKRTLADLERASAARKGRSP